MNKVNLIGRLCAEPLLKFTPGTGTAVTTLTLAVNRRYKKEGQAETDFIPVVVWGKQAESTANYVTKGKLIGVAGRIQVRNYDKDGEKRYVTEVVAEEVHFLEWGDKKPQDNSNAAPTIPDDYFGEGITPDDSGEDIPFN